MSLTMSIQPFRWLRRHMFGERVVDHPPGPSEELEQTARDLRLSLQPYLSRPDPLGALVTDIYNKRAMQSKDKEQHQHDWF